MRPLMMLKPSQRPMTLHRLPPRENNGSPIEHFVQHSCFTFFDLHTVYCFDVSSFYPCESINAYESKYRHQIKWKRYQRTFNLIRKKRSASPKRVYLVSSIGFHWDTQKQCYTEQAERD